MIELARSLGWPVGMSLFAALILLGLVRPAIKGMNQPPAPAAAVASGRQVDAIEADEPERPALAAPTKPEDLIQTPEQMRLEEARVLAKENPMAVANILKVWVNGES